MLPSILVFSLVSLWYIHSHTDVATGRIGFDTASADKDPASVSHDFPDVRNATLGVGLFFQGGVRPLANNERVVRECLCDQPP